MTELGSVPGAPLTPPCPVPAAAQSCDLEEAMMDALVSNKPEFVRLFVDHGASVADFLTYGRLQQLYRAVPPKSLLFDLLQRKHEEGRPAPQARGPPAFSLHDVSRVLKDFLHDACRGFYQAVRGAAGAGAGPRRRLTPLSCRRGGRPEGPLARSGCWT